jgi:Sec7-like guanine-nucleotide exchange factor
MSFRGTNNFLAFECTSVVHSCICSFQEDLETMKSALVPFQSFNGNKVTKTSVDSRT